MSLIELLGYGFLWLVAAVLFALVVGQVFAEVWEDEDYFVEPITERAKQERLAESLLYPRTKLTVDQVVPLSKQITKGSVEAMERDLLLKRVERMERRQG